MRNQFGSCNLKAHVFAVLSNMSSKFQTQYTELAQSKVVGGAGLEGVEALGVAGPWWA